MRLHDLSIRESVRPGLGDFDDVRVEDSSFLVSGWMLLPPSDEPPIFSLYLDGALARRSNAQGRPSNVTLKKPGVAHRFEFRIPPRDARELRNFTRIEVVRGHHKQGVDRITTLYRSDFHAVPTPPEHLMVRVTGNPDAHRVKSAGLRCASEFLQSIQRHRNLDSIQTLLDWGCGSGRVTVHLLDYMRRFPGVRVLGCDIDPEAIQWCHANISQDRFCVIAPEPPTPWPDSSFDVVVACSVLTHLTADSQTAWLEEMRRLIVPGGLLLASTYSAFRGEAAPGSGFSDSLHDPILDGIAPEGYYRETSQTRDYTMRVWSRLFDIVEYLPDGLESSQDLVVMRRPAGASATIETYVPGVSPQYIPPPPVIQPEQPFPEGHFYSPIPSVEEVLRDEERIFRVPDRLAGIELNHDAQLTLLNELATYYPEHPFVEEQQPGIPYYLGNPNYGFSDAIFLYSMLRHAAPRKIIEVGSGFSSAAMLEVSATFFDNEIQFVFIDPNPELLLSLVEPEKNIEILPRRVQDVPVERFLALERNDVLFIDSTHVTKAGSDLNHMLFEVLPILHAGVLIHFHDIFYPFEYPRRWIVELGLAWNENYILRTFLQHNRDFEIVLFNTYLEHFHEEFFKAKMPLCLKDRGGSLWLRKR